MSSSTKPRLLVIGGGFAGVKMASECIKFAEVTLVDPKSYLETTWATVRGILDQQVASRSIMEYKDIPNIGHFVQAAVTRLTPKEATLSTGEVLTFDYAAICCGSSYSDTAFKSATATTRQQRMEELQALANSIQAAKSVVVVGGGPAGVEAAAEVVEAFAGKAVTLVTPGSALLTGLPPKAGRLAQAWLEKHGVKVLLGTKVEGRPSGSGPTTLTLRTAQGSNPGASSLAADLVLWCVGAKPSTAFLGADGAPPSSKQSILLDEKGAVKVLPSLQVEGQPHLFALGDCTNVPEGKLGFLAMKHAEMAASNLKALISAQGRSAAPKLASWTPNMGREVMIVTLGRGDGVCRMGGAVCGGCLPASIKSRGLFVERTRAQLGVR